MKEVKFPDRARAGLWANRIWQGGSRIVFVLSVCLATQLLSGLLSPATAAEPERKRVMILHSFGQDFRPWGAYAKAIRMALTKQSKWPLSISDHALVTARSSDENPEGPFVDFLDALYAKRPPDLIVSIGAPAANFIQRHRNKLFPDVPMILTAVEQRRINVAGLTANDAVVAVAHDFTAVFNNILRLLPDTQTAVIINGASPNEKFWLGELKRELAPFESRMKLLWFENTPFDAILREAASLPPKTAIFWHLLNVDAAGVSYEDDKGLSRLRAVANAPIFSYDDGFFGEDVVGGPMYSVEDISRRTADVAVRILDGEKPSDIKIPATEFATPKYDWRLLHRFDIDEKLLPPGSKILFREAPVWKKYRGQMLSVATVVLMQSALIFGLFYQRRRRRIAEIEGRARMAELAHMNRFATVGELTALLTHELRQPLTAIRINAEMIEIILRAPTPDVAELREIASDICRDDDRAAEVIHRLRSLLRKTPFELKVIDLNELAVEALDFLSGLAVSRGVHMHGSMAPCPLPINGDRIQLQQIVINLVVNAIDALASNPAGKRQLKIWTEGLPGYAEVCVYDNGPGVEASMIDKIFEPFYSTKPNGMGLGLSIVRTIAEAHKGEIRVERPPEGGTLFRLRLPLA